ncbi:30S ribosomal protein S7 [uncultured archaeon]|nr:30S ribosomal protein S7 [uncultured archaeon]
METEQKVAMPKEVQETKTAAEHAEKAKAPVAKEKAVDTKVPAAKAAPKKDFAKTDGAAKAGEAKEFSEPKPVIVKKKSQFSDYKLYNKWSFNDVIVSDLSLMRYITIDPLIMPHTFGRRTRGRFEKANMNIVERLINKIMRSGQGKRKLSGKFIRGRGSCGKKMEAMKIVERAFDIIERQTKQNPIQVLVKAIENSAPREDITRIKRGGVAYSLAVDVSPLKRLDEAVKNIALGGFGASFNKKVTAEQALADEIIAASNNDLKSSAVKRKDEVERIAKASR